jgi:hypothetical protein
MKRAAVSKKAQGKENSRGNRDSVSRTQEKKGNAPRTCAPLAEGFRAMTRPPNFAGHFTVAVWGCGSNCVSYAVIDAITGAVYEKGLPNPNEGYPCGLLYQRDSNLFVVEQSATIQSKCEPSLYVWRGSRFEPI